MKIGIGKFTLLIFLTLVLIAVGLWSVAAYQRQQVVHAEAYRDAVRLWQAQVQSAQSKQLIWLQSRFYSLKQSLLSSWSDPARRKLIDDFRAANNPVRLVWLDFTNNLNEAEPSDCRKLAQTLYSDTDGGHAALFFSCVHQQQPMMGVQGDFRIQGHAASLVILMDYFAFIEEFQTLSGKTFERDEDAAAVVVYRDAELGSADILHSISFDRDQVALGRLQLSFARPRFTEQWLDQAIWMLPLLVFTLLAYWLCHRTLLKPLKQLAENMRLVISARGSTGKKHNQLLAPGLLLLQRYLMQLTQMTRNDPLTGLYNRMLFEERVKQALQEGRRSGRRYALVFLDIIDFANVNRERGRYFGDGLLRQLGQRLTEGLRETDSVARLKEDNFALLLEYSDQAQLSTLLHKVHETLVEPYTVYGRPLSIDVSLGVALYPDQAQEAEALALIADRAMMKAAEAGGGVRLAMLENGVGHSGLSQMQSLRQALDHQEFKLVYQPVVRLNTHGTSYFEVLLRWKEEGVSRMPIQQIITLAENNKVIRPLTRWIIETCCRELSELEDKQVKMAINLSMIDLHDEQLPQQLAAELERFGIVPKQILLEITEGQIMQDQQQVVAILERLTQMGISLSIDDFGTGQASLTYLKNLPVQKLKIDRSFVRDMVVNADDRSIVETTIDLAHRLGIEVVAEGVESREVHDLLQTMGCDYVQGYYISKPLDAAQVGEWSARSVG